MSWSDKRELVGIEKDSTCTLLHVVKSGCTLKYPRELEKVTSSFSMRLFRHFVGHSDVGVAQLVFLHFFFIFAHIVRK